LYFITLNTNFTNFGIKAHLQTYNRLSAKFGSCLRFYTFGTLVSIIPFITPLIFFYSYREAYHSLSSMISTTCIAIIASEALLFVSYFWGAYHFSLSVYIDNEGLLAPSTRSLILVITFLLASASIITGYASLCRTYTLLFLYSSTTLMAITIASTFTSLQTSEYLGLEVSINDSVYGSLLFTITGLHFFHLVVGVILICLSVWVFHVVYTPNSTRSLTSFGMSYFVLPQSDYYCLLYWHFVEILWIFIQVTLYSL